MRVNCGSGHKNLQLPNSHHDLPFSLSAHCNKIWFTGEVTFCVQLRTRPESSQPWPDLNFMCELWNKTLSNGFEIAAMLITVNRLNRSGPLRNMSLLSGKKHRTHEDCMKEFYAFPGNYTSNLNQICTLKHISHSLSFLLNSYIVCSIHCMFIRALKKKRKGPVTSQQVCPQWTQWRGKKLNRV